MGQPDVRGPVRILDRPAQVIPLQGETHHVQGIALEGSRLWVSSVDRPKQRGLLMEFALPEGKLVRSVEVQDGARYHPGGISADRSSLWVPVAEYKRTSSAILQKRSKKTLAVEQEFAVEDHIGCVAVSPQGLIGANWDARELYLWNRRGELIRKVANPHGNAFQDLKFFEGKLVGGGLLADKTGAVDWLELPLFRLVRRLPVGKTDRGVVYTHEGMMVAKGRIWLLPEDGPSRLFVFDLPK